MKKLNYKTLVSMVSVGAVLATINTASAAESENKIWRTSGNKSKYQYGLVEKRAEKETSPLFERPRYTEENYRYNRYQPRKKDEVKENYLTFSVGSTNIDRESYSGTYTNNGTEYDISNNYKLTGASGTSMEFAFGTNIGERLRFELSVGQTDTITEDADDNTQKLSTEVSQYLAGIEFDLIKSHKFSLFVGGGAGIAKINTKSSIYNIPGQDWEDSENIETDIAWRTKVGGKIELSDDLEIFGAYVYSNSGTQKWSNKGLEGTASLKRDEEGELISQKVEVGIRYMF